jgi:hypothetical protein
MVLLAGDSNFPILPLIFAKIYRTGYNCKVLADWDEMGGMPSFPPNLRKKRFGMLWWLHRHSIPNSL